MISKNQIKYIRQLELKKYRKREGVFVAEGPKVVGDLLRRYQPVAVYATEEWWKEERGKRKEICDSATIVTDDELRRISFLQHPQQVLALFRLPQDISLSTFHFPLFLSPLTVCRIPAISAPSSALPTGLVSIQSTAARIQPTLTTPRWYRPRWEVLRG